MSSLLPRGKAAGPSGTTYEHIQSACKRSSRCFDAVHDLAYALATGQCDLPEEMTDCRGIPLVKPDSSLRPICVGEVWLRIAAVYLLALLGKAGTALSPLQLGIDVPGGADAIGHSLQAALDAEPDAVVVSLDFRNAFNSVKRSSMATAVAERCPAALPFFYSAYGRPSRVFVEGARNGTPPILCTSGVRQGCRKAAVHCRTS